MQESAQKLDESIDNLPSLEDVSLKLIPVRIIPYYIELLRAKANVDDRTLKATVERAIRLYCLGTPDLP